MDGYEVGQDITVDIFQPGEKVKVTGTSKGKGFQGVMKRLQLQGPQGLPRRGEGSPLRRFHRHQHRALARCQGKKMAGHMGDDRVTLPSVEIVDVRPEENIIVVKGQVPGCKNGLVMIRKAG